MTGRTHFILIATLPGAVAVVAAIGDFLAWTMRWPVDITWASIPVLLLWATVIAYKVLWRRDASRDQLHRACVFLLVATYLGVTSSMLLLQEALSRTR
jgi:hypothetical protein